MSYEDLKAALKQFCDEYYTEDDMEENRLMWAVCSIDKKTPILEALNAVGDVLAEYRMVEMGLIPHW